MRCGVEKCRQRFTLKRHPDRYARLQPCPACGDTLHVRSVEAERRRERAKQTNCICGGLPYKHRKGSYKSCVYSPHFNEPWTEEEIEGYKGMMATPRSG